MNNQIITQNTLDEFGIQLPDDDAASLIAHLNDTLHDRVGAEITASLDDEKLEVLLGLQKEAPDEEVSNWLRSNVDDLEEIIEDETNILLGEFAKSSDAIRV